MTDKSKDGACNMCGDSRGQEVICRFICASREHRKAICRYSADIGLHHSQHRMLMHLTNNKVIRSQRQLAEHFGISPAAVATMLKKLEADGYIARAKSANGQDSRNNEIVITELGRKVATETEQYFRMVDCQAIKDFNEDEIEQFILFLERIKNNLAELETDKTGGEE